MLVTCKERNCDSFLAPKLAQLHQRARVNVQGNLLFISLVQRVMQLLCGTLKTGGACIEDCCSWEALSVMFYYTCFYHTFSSVSGRGCFSLASKFTSICVWPRGGLSTPFYRSLDVCNSCNVPELLIQFLFCWIFVLEKIGYKAALWIQPVFCTSDVYNHMLSGNYWNIYWEMHAWTLW